MKKTDKTVLMAAAFAAAASFSACHNFDDYTTVYGPPPDTDSSVLETLPPPQPEYGPMWEPEETEEATATTTSATATSATEDSTTESSTETESSTDTETPAVTVPPDEEGIPGTAIVYDPSQNELQLFYGPPSFLS